MCPNLEELRVKRMVVSDECLEIIGSFIAANYKNLVGLDLREPANTQSSPLFRWTVRVAPIQLRVTVDNGALDNTGKFARSSTWTTIVRECGNLSSKGINLLSHMKRKVGNGLNTLF
ncbi:hypothetical protein Tco_0520337 [Tanacetum coccineum]